MTNQRDAVPLACIVLLCGALAGCEAMSQPFPEKDFYAVEVGVPPAPAAKQNIAAVRVRRLRIAQPYDGRAFVYRTGPSKFRTDYYHGFITSPDHLLTGELVDWLAGSQLFAAVMDSGGEGEHQYVLDGSVSELCGDYADVNSPKAVVAARFFLLDDSGADTRVVFQKAYRKEAALDGQTPEAMAAGLGAAYREMLAGLTADLGAAQLPSGGKPTARGILPQRTGAPE